MLALLSLGWELLAVIGLGSIILIASIENDREGVATVALLVGSAAVFFLTHTNPWVWLSANTSTIIWSVFGYFIVGLIWSFWKWYLYALDIRDQVKEAGGLAKWKDSYSYGARLGRASIPLKASDHKGRIIGWMTYWPWSALWWFLHEPVTRAWQFVYARTTAAFQAVSNHVFREIT